VVVGTEVVLPACSKITTCATAPDGEIVDVPIGNGSGMLWLESDEHNQLGMSLAGLFFSVLIV
jgi:hypothetical protein